MSERIEVAALSDVGRVRKLNEDSFAYVKNSGLFIVADGMGGHDAGEVASKAAVNAVSGVIKLASLGQRLPEDEDHTLRLGNPLQPKAGVDADQMVETIKRAIHRANAEIFRMNDQRGYPEGRGMGTTLVGFWAPGAADKIYTFNVGDSRLYRFRDGKLEQITRDHTLWQEWNDNGQVGAEPRKNVILRAIGPWRTVEADVTTLEAQSQDLYLVCSDGLTGMVDDEVIAQELASTTDLEATCARLIELANANGGKDNVTAVLCRRR
ncbi:PP2C family protein-serine/threonine phosphatase [Zavarzinia sp. CC-PAN008]|uniref:PP2C family protein-serine/threonine phosphatase n=1 Tax=Zavarzinia sp. CC-PAN008 TaxID=3243332 RepID=UPI003F7423C3